MSSWCVNNHQRMFLICKQMPDVWTIKQRLPDCLSLVVQLVMSHKDLSLLVMTTCSLDHVVFVITDWNKSNRHLRQPLVLHYAKSFVVLYMHRRCVIYFCFVFCVFICKHISECGVYVCVCVSVCVCVCMSICVCMIVKIVLLLKRDSWKPYS